MAGVFVAYICDDVFHRLFCFCEEMGSLKQTSFLEILAECVRRIFLHEAADIIVRLMAALTEFGKSGSFIVCFYIIERLQHHLLLIGGRRTDGNHISPL